MASGSIPAYKLAADRASGARSNFDRNVATMENSTLNWLVIGDGDITTPPVILARKRVGAAFREFSLAILPRRSRTAPRSSRISTRPRRRSHQCSLPGFAVFLNTPQMIASHQSGSHVLCEKPMAMDYIEVESRVVSAGLGVAESSRRSPMRAIIPEPSGAQWGKVARNSQFRFRQRRWNFGAGG
jgi:hypothetical protein